MLVSIVIPAHDEEDYIGQTLASLNRARAFLQEKAGVSVEIVVVDNESDDSTAEVARKFNVTVAKEMQHNVARARNAGAKLAKGDVLVFVDADTIVPEILLERIVEDMSKPGCFGGAVDTAYRPKKLTAKIYLQIWRIIGKLAGMAQGATQFCRRDTFLALNGYDETLFMGEDVDFHWRLKRFAKRQNGRTVFIDDIQVAPSARRFDQWRLWRTLVWTNPLFILLFRRRKTSWQGWYKKSPR